MLAVFLWLYLSIMLNLTHFNWSKRRETPAGKACLVETPQERKRRGSSTTAREKRVPAAEIATFYIQLRTCTKLCCLYPVMISVKLNHIKIKK